MLPPLRLKPQEDRRLRAGHVWVFSNEVDTAKTPLTAFEPGTMAVVQDAAGHALGVAHVNPQALICARLLGRDPTLVWDKSLIVHRLNIALGLRERWYTRPFYRLCFGESDFLPGLVVDRYDDVLVAQLTTAGMERHKEAVRTALLQVMRPRVLIWRNDSSRRDLEGLPLYMEIAHGVEPEYLTIEEGEARFHAPWKGQKTGWFYDHRDNRALMRRCVAGRRVLDVFSYVGAWGIAAAQAGAGETLCVDSAASALEQLQANAVLNGVAERVRTVTGDAFEVLRDLRAARERFDVVILDPPAFIKRKKDFKEGAGAYRRLNQQALQVLSKDGILISGSCSHHLPRATLQDILFQASRHLDRTLQVLAHGYQSLDHPIHPALPETEYLKAITCRVGMT